MNVKEAKTEMQISDARIKIGSLKASISYSGVYRTQDLPWLQSELATAERKLQDLLAKAGK
jgi:hypothetical protein